MTSRSSETVSSDARRASVSNNYLDGKPTSYETHSPIVSCSNPGCPVESVSPVQQQILNGKVRHLYPCRNDPEDSHVCHLCECPLTVAVEEGSTPSCPLTPEEESPHSQAGVRPRIFPCLLDPHSIHVFSTCECLSELPGIAENTDMSQEDE